jgi:ABC-type bacteriocin/lantibiotic exporter with double-glycine peptidase domain
MKIQGVNSLPLFKIFVVVRRALTVLASRDRIKAAFLVLIYAFLGLLDIAAVFVFGLVGSLAVSGVSSNRPGLRVNTFLEFLGISDKNLQTQVAVLGLIAASVLIFKSFASLYLSKRTLFFLSRRSAIISRNLMNRLLGQEILRVRGRTIQETIFALTAGVQAVTVSILGSSLLLIADVFLIIAFSISLFLVDTLVALLSLILFSSIGILMYAYMHKRAQELGELATRLEIRSNDKISEVVSCYRELSVKNRRNFYAQEIGGMRLSIAEAGANLGVMNLLSKYIMEITMVIGGLAIGAAQFIAQPATRAVAVISIFLISSARIAPAILRVQTGLMTIKTSIGTAKPTLDLIEEYLKDGFVDSEPVESYRGKEQFSHSGFSPNVRASNVSFSYPNRKKRAISNLNLIIQEGKFVGIVGPSGSGKTTLVDILLGIVYPEVGSIEISGANPAEVIQLWPGAIAYVPQDTSIINGTIKENICLGYLATEVPDQIAIELLGAVQLEELLSLPEGIHSSTGERGSKLSGGQKQRIGLARALFTNPKLLVLDEATSALDATTEKKLTSYLTSLKGSLTMIVIAHRLSTVINADTIFYMKDGKVLDEGTFKELRDRIPEFNSQAKAMGL